MFLSEAEDGDITEVHCKCSALQFVTFEAVGRFYEACVKRQRLDKSVSMLVEDELQEDDDDDDLANKELTEDDKNFILSLNAAEWKKQDHYQVLRIQHLRCKATDDDVRKAYRRMVLRYHPDKKKSDKNTELPNGVNIHEYFTCITRAFEQLSTLEGRQTVDSVDPLFDDTIPSFSSTSKQNFFKVFEPVFAANARWSREQPAPLLGDGDTTQDEVNDFYNFWYTFSSWRNYGYMDEEDTDKAESREERRWMERENKTKRQKRKKDELQRIKNLVDLAYQNDPRLKKFKEEEKQRKLKIKKEKEQVAQEKEQQRLIVLEEEKKQKELAEQEVKEKTVKEKKEKEKQRKAAAKDRKIVRQFVKSENFFKIDKDEVASLERLEKSLENLTLDSLQNLKELVDKKDKDTFKKKYLEKSNEILKKLDDDAERRKQEEQALAAAVKQQSVTAQANADGIWSDIELQLLVKATTLFPIGTVSRWDVIANYINEHAGNEGNKKNGKQIINKVKNLKKLDPSVKDEVNKKAFQTLEKTTAAKQNAVSATTIKSDISVKDQESGPWSSDEQKLLEQALKKFGSTTPERWDKISGHVGTRTKRECMKRYKELVEMVKAKKAAAVASKN